MDNKDKDFVVNQIPLKIKPVKSPKKIKDTNSVLDKKSIKLKIYSTIKIIVVLLLLIINTYLIVTIAIKIDDNNKVSFRNPKETTKQLLSPSKIGNWKTSNNGLFIFGDDNNFYWYDNYEHLTSNYYLGTYSYKNGYEALEEIGYTEDEFFKNFGNNTKINNAYSINMKPLYSYHGGIDTTSSNITEKETWWFIMIIKDDGTALAYNKTLDLHYTLNKY